MRPLCFSPSIIMVLAVLPLVKSGAVVVQSSDIQQDASPRPDIAFLTQLEVVADQTESWMMQRMTSKSTPGVEFFSFLISLIPLSILLGTSYWVYKTNQEMLKAGQDVKIGMRSVGCCFLCCFGLGTPAGLCFPIDEDKKAVGVLA
mmetsp:Transcript_39733/g.127321  ORF Transcript_39733/g.127321 Transcript_39733/m.127321 type:complete len:146 (+) Transcript_39733:76-513(+)